MAITINLAQNNTNNTLNSKSDKTGRKTIFACNNMLSENQSIIEAKRNMAKKQVAKLVNDAWDKDNKISDNIKKMSESIDRNNSEIDNLKSKLNDLEENKKVLQEEYGVLSDSQEQKDLELLQKYQDYKNGQVYEKFSKEEIIRLKELQDVQRTEYQNKVLELNDTKNDISKTINEKSNEILMLYESIKNVEDEQLKSHNMSNAKKASVKIMEALSDEIKSLILKEAKDKIDEIMEEAEEKAEKLKEEKEKREEELKEAKEKREEQEDLIEADIEAARIEQDTKINEKNVSHLSDMQKEIKIILKDNNLIDEDLKGIKIDFNF